MWHWHPSPPRRWSLPFLVIECTFMSANLLKVSRAAGCPCCSAASCCWSCSPGVAAAHLLFEKTRRQRVPLADLVDKAGSESAAAHRRHRDLPHQRPGEHADGAAAQPQALPCAAREQRHPDHGDRGHACRGGAGDDRASVGLFLRITVRFGFTETPNLPRTLCAQGRGFTYDVMTTPSSFAALAEGVEAVWHADLAGQNLHDAGTQR